jgi:hypothetical protein
MTANAFRNAADVGLRESETGTCLTSALFFQLGISPLKSQVCLTEVAMSSVERVRYRSVLLIESSPDFMRNEKRVSRETGGI